MSFGVSQAMLSNSLKIVFFAFLSIWIPLASAQDSERLQGDLSEWLLLSATDITHMDLSASLDDLSPLREMIGDARIVAVSESNHAAREPMLFRNRVFRFLVEELGFEAIVLESGLVESQVLNEYVMGEEFDSHFLFDRGISNGFDQFQQNQELVNWIKTYNSTLPESAAKLQIFGFDVSGSPYYSDATRNPDTAILTALEYLQTVDSASASEFTIRFERYLPVLANIFDYGMLSIEERDALTSSITDLITLFQRRRFQFIQLSDQRKYEWGAQAAVAASQADNWFRQIPIDWEPSYGFEWNDVSQEIRDRVMFDNLEWILEQVSPGGRVVVFASVGHITATQRYVGEDEAKTSTVPFGMYARAKYGKDFINILSLVVNGAIAVCYMPEAERVPMVLVPPPEESLEAMFTLNDKPQYLIDLRSAPTPVLNWLKQEHQHWNGFGSWVFPTVPAFDLAYYVSPISSDCVQ